MPSYSDSEMREIMGRALQIDSGRTERFTPEQLRTIAAELGISTQALEVAMYEADSKGRATNLAPTTAPRSTSRWAKGLAVAVGVLILAAGAVLFVRLTPGGRSDVAAHPARPFAYETAPALPAPVTPAPAPAAPVKAYSPGGPKKTTTKRF
jgi:hypothetical protein